MTLIELNSSLKSVNLQLNYFCTFISDVDKNEFFAEIIIHKITKAKYKIRKSIGLEVVISKILFIKNTSILQPHINVLCGKRLAVAGM